MKGLLQFKVDHGNRHAERLDELELPELPSACSAQSGKASGMAPLVPSNVQALDRDVNHDLSGAFQSHVLRDPQTSRETGMAAQAKGCEHFYIGDGKRAGLSPRKEVAAPSQTLPSQGGGLAEASRGVSSALACFPEPAYQCV